MWNICVKCRCICVHGWGCMCAMHQLLESYMLFTNNNYET